jgi:NADH-quinone oxidoreductase subunit M
MLSATLWLPLAGAIVVALVPRDRHAAHRWIALATSIASFGLTLAVLARFHTGEPGYQMVEHRAWIDAIGASYKLGIDGISLFLVVLTGFLMPIGVLASWKVDQNPKLFMMMLLALQTAVLGVFLSLDLLLFMLFWDAVLVPMYFLIGYWGYEKRVYAAVKFFLYTFLGGVLMLAGIVALAVLARGQTGGLTFDVEKLSHASFALGTQRWLFLSFFAAFAIKVPLFPLHTWLPDAHTEAPTAGSIVLAALLLKMGTYGFVRFSIPLFPNAARELTPFVVTLALIGIIYGAIVAAMQTDLKRLVAYSSVSHLGFVVLGIFALTTQGLQGGTLQMINHGVSTGALFLLVGMLYERRHTRLIADYGGIARAVPWLAGLFLVMALSSIALPGTNGFVGEFLILVGAFVRERLWAIIAAAGMILSALYLLWAYQRVFHGPMEITEPIPDLRVREALAAAPLVAAALLMGVWPKPFLDRMGPSLEVVRHRVQQSQGSAAVATAGEAVLPATAPVRGGGR